MRAENVMKAPRGARLESEGKISPEGGVKKPRSKNVNCEVCGKASVKGGGLTTHMQLHSGWEAVPSLPEGWKIKDVIIGQKTRKQYRSPKGVTYSSFIKALFHLNELDTEHVWTQEGGVFVKRKKPSQNLPEQSVTGEKFYGDPGDDAFVEDWESGGEEGEVVCDGDMDQMVVELMGLTQDDLSSVLVSEMNAEGGTELFGLDVEEQEIQQRLMYDNSVDDDDDDKEVEMIGIHEIGCFEKALKECT